MREYKEKTSVKTKRKPILVTKIVPIEVERDEVVVGRPEPVKQEQPPRKSKRQRQREKKARKEKLIEQTTPVGDPMPAHEESAGLVDEELVGYESPPDDPVEQEQKRPSVDKQLELDDSWQVVQKGQRKTQSGAKVPAVVHRDEGEWPDYQELIDQQRVDVCAPPPTYDEAVGQTSLIEILTKEFFDLSLPSPGDWCFENKTKGGGVILRV
jgi:hypothetical protein